MLQLSIGFGSHITNIYLSWLWIGDYDRYISRPNLWAWLNRTTCTQNKQTNLCNFMILTRSTLQFSYLCKNAKDSSINDIICHYFSIVAQLTPQVRLTRAITTSRPVKMYLGIKKWIYQVQSFAENILNAWSVRWLHSALSIWQHSLHFSLKAELLPTLCFLLFSTALKKLNNIQIKQNKKCLLVL